MKILGAIIAGGKARRFGTDKANAMINGRRMIDLVANALSPQTQGLVICGRDEGGFPCLADRPEAGLGPLGGINAAIHHAGQNGYDAVLSVACDIPNLPDDLLPQILGENRQSVGAAVVADQPIVGLWPISLAPMLDQYLHQGNRRIYGFARQAGAREITLRQSLLNVNTPQDLPD